MMNRINCQSRWLLGASSLIAATVLVALTSSAARADVLLYEGFDYANGADLSGLSGGTGFAPGSQWGDFNGENSGVGGTIVGANSLSYTDAGGKVLKTSGGHYSHLGGPSILRKLDVDAIAASSPGVIFEDKTNFTPGNHIGKDGSTVWVSFLYQSAVDTGSPGWGGISFDDGDENGDGELSPVGTAGNHSDASRHDFGFSLPPDPSLDGTGDGFEGVRRMLRGFDVRGDMGGEKQAQNDPNGPLFSLGAHRGRTVKVEDDLGHPYANASKPTLVLMRMDFTGDPSDPNTNSVEDFKNPGTNIIEPNEFYETWPKADEADQIRLWLNPSLDSEPAVGTEAALLDYQSESSVLTFAPQDLNNLNPANREDHYFADRFDFKFDGIHLNAEIDGTVYDELRIGTTFGDVTPIEGATTAEPGDYDASGAVGQGDLDLVLLNWGNTAPPIPAGWVNEQPSGLIGQGNLDGVLLNWGNGSSTVAGVPEPTSMALALLGLCGVAASRRKRS